jgi:hypothetical protein
VSWLGTKQGKTKSEQAFPPWGLLKKGGKIAREML